MAISYAFALAAITQQVNQINESVNGAFLPLISNACEIPQRLNAEEAFRRCTAIARLSQEVENTATEGMRHLEAFRNGQLVVDNLSDGFLSHLEGLAKACRGAKVHIVEMFTVAEKSPMWQGHLGMLRPLRRKYVRALTAVENTAIQLAAEVRQSLPAQVELLPSQVTREEAIDLISASHKMLGVNTPKWM
ncbi:hypothetical protein ABK178_004645 [Salmonella enterica subsp. enterica serovar Brandenburg]|nr:hypothetical protein [Salmonella enterica subsp. enterica serovar Johannesburg]EDT6458694.1 hypothetical protein [Salmonella enterica subsp. enterica]EIC3510633.1 hypothetical protein [Salmonella enterica subsp. enterica serovar Oranienburg]